MSKIDVNNFIKDLSKIEGVLNTFVIKTLKENDFCVCGSNLTYSSCCQQKITDAFRKYHQIFITRGEVDTNFEINKAIGDYIEHKKKKKTPSNRVYNKSLEKKNIRFCLADNHYGACDDSIVYAHTISRNPILANLSSGTKLITFDRHVSFPKPQISDYFEYISVEEASIVNTFCKIHDKELFKDIENSNAYTSHYLQDLQYALNCISVSVYTDILQIQHFQKMIKECPELWLENAIFSDYKNHIERLKDDYKTSQFIIESIKNKTDVLTTFSFVLDNYSTNFAICEQKLIRKNALGEEMDEPDFYFLNIHPYINNSTLFILSSETHNLVSMDVFNQLDQMVRNNRINEILSFFASIISENSSNVYFNSSYFNGLTESEKALIYFNFSNNGALRISNSIKSEFFANTSVEELEKMYKNILFKDY